MTVVAAATPVPWVGIPHSHQHPRVQRANTAPLQAQANSLQTCYMGDLWRPYGDVLSSRTCTTPTMAVSSSHKEPPRLPMWPLPMGTPLPVCQAPVAPVITTHFMPWEEQSRRLACVFQNAVDVSPMSSAAGASPAVASSPIALAKQQVGGYMPVEEHCMRLARVFQDATPGTSRWSPTSPAPGTFCLPPSPGPPSTSPRVATAQVPAAATAQPSSAMVLPLCPKERIHL